MLTTEIDMAKLGRSPGNPANGIVYAGAFQPGVDFPAWGGGGGGVGPPAWAGYPTPWAVCTGSLLTTRTRRASRRSIVG